VSDVTENCYTSLHGKYGCLLNAFYHQLQLLAINGCVALFQKVQAGCQLSSYEQAT